MQKVSIIIPVYNSEDSLERCLKTVAVQTYENYEVIVVDDGSTDYSGHICDMFAGKYEFIHSTHQHNKGQASARNHGVKVSKGELITFIDSDDYVEPDYVDYLVWLTNKYNADVAISGFRYSYDKKRKRAKHNSDKDMEMTPVEAIHRMNYTKGYGAVPWAKMFRRSIVERYPFPEGQLYEDLAIMYKMIDSASTVAYGSKETYNWIQHEGSTMRSKLDERQMHSLDVVLQQLDYMKNMHQELIPSVKARYESKIVELMGIAIRDKNRQENYRVLKSKSKYADEVLRDTNVKTSIKARMLAIRAGFYPTRAVFTLHEMMKETRFK